MKMLMKYENVVDNNNSLYNNNITINYFNVFKQNQPFLVWPKESEGNTSNNDTLNFLPLFGTHLCSDKVLPLKQNFIHFKTIKNHGFNINLLYVYSASNLIFYQFNSKKNIWNKVQTLNSSQIPKLTFKSIIDYNELSQTLVIYCDVEKILYIYRNVLSNKFPLKTDTIKVEIKNSIVGIKWSNLVLSIYSIDEIVLLEWESIQDVGSISNYKIYRFGQYQDNQFIKLQWIDNENFLITTQKAISYKDSSDKESFETLELPGKKSIQILDIIDNISKEEKGDNDDQKENQILRPNNSTTSVPSLFMINSTKEENSYSTLNNRSGLFGSNGSNGGNSKSHQDNSNSRSSLLLLKFINDEIKLIDSIKINNHISSPNLLAYNDHQYISVSSTFSNKIDLIKYSNNKLTSYEALELPEPSKCSIRSIGFLNNNNNNNNGDNGNSSKIYALVGEKLNSKGIGLSYQPKSNYKISLYSFRLDEPIVNQQTPRNPFETTFQVHPFHSSQQSFPQSPQQSSQQSRFNNINNNPTHNNHNDNNNTNNNSFNNNSLQTNDILNLQSLILDKLTSIENILNNHTKRIENIENNIQEIKNKIK